MVFFATDKIYRVIQIKQKNEYGQLIISSSIENLPYMVNVQPIEEKTVKYTFGEDIQSTLQAYVEKEMNFCTGDLISYNRLIYEVEKKVPWKSYEILALKRVDVKIGN